MENEIIVDVDELSTDSLKILQRLLKAYRDMSVDREEWEKRESVRFDVEFDVDAAVCNHNPRHGRGAGGRRGRMSDGQNSEMVRYLTDDRDESHRNELVIMQGGNGDWYVAVVPEGEGTIGRAVRLCTSGGASSRCPGLTGAIANAFRAIAQSQPQPDAGEQERRQGHSALVVEDGAIKTVDLHPAPEQAGCTDAIAGIITEIVAECDSLGRSAKTAENCARLGGLKWVLHLFGRKPDPAPAQDEGAGGEVQCDFACKYSTGGPPCHHRLLHTHGLMCDLPCRLYSKAKCVAALPRTAEQGEGDRRKEHESMKKYGIRVGFLMVAEIIVMAGIVAICVPLAVALVKQDDIIAETALYQERMSAFRNERQKRLRYETRKPPEGWTIQINGFGQYTWTNPHSFRSCYYHTSRGKAVEDAWDQYEYEQRKASAKGTDWKAVE